MCLLRVHAGWLLSCSRLMLSAIPIPGIFWILRVRHFVGLLGDLWIFEAVLRHAHRDISFVSGSGSAAVSIGPPYRRNIFGKAGEPCNFCTRYWQEMLVFPARARLLYMQHRKID